MLTGIFIGIEKFQNSKAFNDTTVTWNYNNANVAQFTYDASLVSVNSNNTLPGINKITNNSFDTDLAGWSGGSGYALDDQFTTDRNAGSVNNSVAEPIGGARSVITI